MSIGRVWLAPICFLAAAGSAVPAGVAWRPLDFPAAMRQAENEGKLIYVFVEGDNCPPCQAFKESHLDDPAFVDFVNSLYVPLRAHENDPAAKEFLRSLGMNHGAIPRFYVLTAGGGGVSMNYGLAPAAPMGAASALIMASGRELPVDRRAASALAGRLRAHAASRRAVALGNAADYRRRLGLAVLEAQAWALAGNLEEAEKAFGEAWADRLGEQEVREWYVGFWLGWGRNLSGALAAARAFLAASPGDPAGHLLVGRALAANRRFPEAVREGENYLARESGDGRAAAEIDGWRRGR
ncbi:MAG: thioredoxin family protein [Planctomycetota bacterium]|jgi:hypothetical protein|nr:thioredoxin family protein [Planctomycetota bacterium]